MSPFVGFKRELGQQRGVRIEHLNPAYESNLVVQILIQLGQLRFISASVMCMCLMTAFP